MISLRFEQLVEMTGGTLLHDDYGDRSFTGVSVDSRTITPGQLFVAIRGERHDGHDFMKQAAYRGAAGILLEAGIGERCDPPPNMAAVEVPDSHEAMLLLAGKYLNAVRARRVGITGSNGKTTTKEFTYSLLSAVESDIYRSPGNYNNLFGIPLAVFAMPEATRIAVLEMGISVPGEMSRLAAVVRPHVIAITNVSPTHLETLRSVETVAREKLAVVREASPDVPVIVNADDELLIRETARLRSDYISFAIDREADFRTASMEHTSEGIAEVTIEKDRFSVPLFGRYQVYNLLAAYAIVKTMGYGFGDVDTENIQLFTSDWRGEVVAKRGVTFIADCYNANPDSVRSGLQSFADYPGGRRRIIILGDMLELGEEAAKFHEQVGKELAAQSFDLAALVGSLSHHTGNAAHKAGVAKDRLRYFKIARACAEQMKNHFQPGDLVYLKGSRGIGLEVVIEAYGGEEAG